MKNNRSNHSRTERNHTEKSKVDKVYYIVITVLILILVGLVTYFFFLRDNSTSQVSENVAPSSEIISETDESNTQNSDQNEIEEENQSETTDSEETSDENSEQVTEEEVEEEEDIEEDSEVADVEEVESDDPLVEEAYTGEWSPIGTSQSGEHTTDFSDGSQDRVEISEAVSSVTGLEAGSMTEWWIGGNGPSQVEATVSSQDESEVYRVYLQFVEEEGWQPTRVELLSEVPSDYQ